MRDRLFKNRKGFSLAEALVVVAIMMILFALGVPALIQLKKNLRQKELDTKAETIYVAVQNRLTELYATGRQRMYDPEQDLTIRELGALPGDYDADDDGYLGAKLRTDSLHYFRSESNAAETIVTKDVLDESLNRGHWIVEILPYTIPEEGSGADPSLTAATVYAVFYSEDLDIQNDYPIFYDAEYSYDILRTKEGRLKQGAMIGYYGGANIASSSTTSDLRAIVQFHNAEKLTASVTCTKPMTLQEDLKLDFVLSDTAGNKYTVSYNEATNLFYTQDGLPDEDKNITVSKLGRKFMFTVTLDDLSEASTRFDALYGSASGHSQGNMYPDRELLSGTEITLTVIPNCTDHTVQTREGSDKTNSLFAYDKNGTADTALIRYGRHLQNLDTGSHVVDTVTAAQQIGTISFRPNSSWNTTYGKKYYNGITPITRYNASSQITVDVPAFHPIINPNLTVYQGGNYAIQDLTIDDHEESAGLFAEVNSSQTLTMNDLILTGTRIQSEHAAGSLIGRVSGTANLTHCIVYLTRGYDIPSSINPSMNAEALIWIEGKQSAGGFAGEVDGTGQLNISDSSASTVLDGGNAGGLVGKNNGQLNVWKTYADSYIYGSNAGGLVGNSNNAASTVLYGCYSAGFIGLKSNGTGAGLVCGPATSAIDTYTIVAPYLQDSDGGIDKTKHASAMADYTYYSTAKSFGSEPIHVYYMNGGIGVQGTTVINEDTIETMKNELISDDSFFTDSVYGTRPYSMMGQYLSQYNYPGLKGLIHYGDWESEFQSGSLVYYEKYHPEHGDDYFGFEGAGADNSLNDEDTIVGDGYGIVFPDTDAIPSLVTVRIGGDDGEEKSYDLTERKASAYRVMVEGVSYLIFPLDLESVNPEEVDENFYTPISITQGSSTGAGATGYYYFNPHFARAFMEAVSASAEDIETPENIAIRSPRHLYNLSLHYDDGYQDLIEQESVFTQERDMIYSSYEWNQFFDTTVDTITEQQPIGGSDSTPFIHTYEGNCHIISDISIVTVSGDYIGLFGDVDTDGILKDIALVTDYDKDGDAIHDLKNHLIKREDPAGANTTVYYGVLAGKNNGLIDNCAVAGYYLTGVDGTIHGYQNSTIYIGGLVGQNDGEIQNSTADCPRVSLSMYRSSCYAGGFVGENSGGINDCYDLGHILSDAQGGVTLIAGFAAKNTGIIRDSYCATALTASGNGSKSFGFVPDDDGGYVDECYYLSTGSYEYVDGLYAYETKTGLGEFKTYVELKELNTNEATHSYFHKNTEEDKYPFRAVVSNAKMESVHYGDWQREPQLGNLGIFYWEHEEHGQNNGYKLTYIGNDSGNSHYQTTLCTAHDDGGVITSFGYGYYVRRGENASLAMNGFAYDNSDIGPNTTVGAAKKALEQQIPGYYFYPYVTTTDTTTPRYLYLNKRGTTDDKIGDWELSDGSRTYHYKLTPFFANAMQAVDPLNNDKIVIKDAAEHTSVYTAVPGEADNQYEVRSAEQLQYINWNSDKKNASTLIASGGGNKHVYPYLWYTSKSGTATEKRNTANNREYRYWLQSHDLNAEQITNFTPIAGQEIASKGDSYNAMLYAWFGGSYDGQSYKISELNITSSSATVGVFGVATGASIKNVILYSEKNAKIVRDTEYRSDNQTSYALGGLLGVAYSYSGETGDSIQNCSVAGYQIIDNSRNKMSLGEACIGGLAGVANVSVDTCSAVVDITVNTMPFDTSGKFTYARWGNFIRVGGVTGACLGKVTNCYSGGTIHVSPETLDQNYSSSNQKIALNSTTGSYDVSNSTNIYIAGISGSGFAMNYQNFTNSSNLKEGSPYVENCYTYMRFPDYEGTIRSIALITSRADRYNQGGVSVTIKNCYYLNSCADIDISKAPKFSRLDRPSAYSLLFDKQYQSKNYFMDMLNGNSRYIGMLLQRSESSVGSPLPYPRDYSQLSHENMVNELGGNTVGYGKWNKVTIKDKSGGVITGKYSFPAGWKHLTGKDYPFPTVITQMDQTFKDTVHVHYGEWSFSGAYWEKAIDTMDILDCLSEKQNGSQLAEQTFILHKNGAEFDGTDKTDYDVSGGYAQVDRVSPSDDGKSLYVTVQALKTGTTTITEKTSGASFVLDITANLSVTADPPTMVLANGASADMTLTARSGNGSDYSNDGQLTWDIIPSKNASKDGDAGYRLKHSSVKNVYIITGYGVDASLHVQAKYEYPRNSGRFYTGSTKAMVQKPSVLGLSNGTSYLETQVSRSDITEISGVPKSFGDKEPKPTSGECSFFLYDTELADILTNFGQNSVVEVRAQAAKEGIPQEKLSVHFAKAAENQISTGFRIVKGTIFYDSNEESEGDLDGVSLTVAVKRQNATYKFTMNDVTAKKGQPSEDTAHQKFSADPLIDDISDIPEAAPVITAGSRTGRSGPLEHYNDAEHGPGVVATVSENPMEPTEEENASDDLSEEVIQDTVPEN